MCRPVHEARGCEPGYVRSTSEHARNEWFLVFRVRRNIRMLSHLKGRLAHRLAMLAAIIAFLFTFAAFARAQEQPPPKWELFGGYSVFDPGATITGQLPGALLPLSSRL